MQHHLVQHAAQHIAGVGLGERHFHRLGDGGAQAAAGVVGVFRQHFPAHRRGVGGGRDDIRAVDVHERPALRFLLVGAAHHIHGEVQPEIAARHGERRAPLSRTRLGGDAGEPLLLGVVRLRDGAVELVRSAGVVALEFVVYLRGRVQIFFKTVRTHERGGTIHLVEVAHGRGDLDISVLVIQLLFCKLGAEHRLQFRKRHGLVRCRIEEGTVIGAHIGTHVVPFLGQLVFCQVDFVRDLLFAHRNYLRFLFFCRQRRQKCFLCPCAPFGTRFVFRSPSSPICNTHRVLSRERLRASILPRAIKNPTARLAVGDKVKDSAVPPRLTRHRCRIHSSTANTVRLLTRALRPRLLVTFRLGPLGPILSGSVPAGITPSPTLSQSVSRFLPVNGLLSCFYAITAFSPCQRILTRFFKFSARERAPVRTQAHAHVVLLLFRAARQIFPRVPRANVECSRAGSFSARTRSSFARHAFDKRKMLPAPKTHAQNHKRISMILCARQRVVRPHTACFAPNDYS